MNTASLLWIAAIVAVASALAGVMRPGAPLLFVGLWLMAWLDGYARVGVQTVVMLALAALVVCLQDYAATAKLGLALGMLGVFLFAYFV